MPIVKKDGRGNYYVEGYVMIPIVAYVENIKDESNIGRSEATRAIKKQISIHIENNEASELLANANNIQFID